MDHDKDAAIRARAFQLWQESGGAHGHHEEHWRQAEAEYGGAAVVAAHPPPEKPGAIGPHVDGVSPLPAQDATAAKPDA